MILKKILESFDNQEKDKKRFWGVLVYNRS